MSNKIIMYIIFGIYLSNLLCIIYDCFFGSDEHINPYDDIDGEY